MAAAEKPSVMRHARMPVKSAVLMIQGDQSWTSDVEDISSTGVMVRRPHGWTGTLGELFVLDMMFGAKVNIHLKATVARLTREHIGFAYERIPPNKEKPLWDLLGRYADKLERFPSNNRS
jgi:PilZ domain-containing protein